MKTGAAMSAEQALRLHLASWGRRPETIVMRGPAVLPENAVVATGYPAMFPNLLGVVRAFGGGRAEHLGLIRAINGAADWGVMLGSTGTVLAPAACHVVYEVMRNQDVAECEYEVHTTCFRNEETAEVGRLRSFEMLEFVYLGNENGAARFATTWRERALAALATLGLTCDVVPATDPFFGAAAGAVTANGAERKHEVRTSLGGRLLAVASVNLHGTHFGESFSITSDGAPAISACVGFGLERILLALESSSPRQLDDWISAGRR